MKFPETAKRLSYILALRDMSAQELANRSGVGKSSISHYINGSNEPHNKNAGMMATVLRVNPQWLMGFDVEMEDSIPHRSPEEEKVLTLFQNATPEMRQAALAVLKAGQRTSEPSG